jgi:acetyltransferase
MVQELRVFPILEGVRGQEPSDVGALVASILAVTRLVTDFPEIGELDLNPIRVLAPGDGCRVLDTRIHLAG